MAVAIDAGELGALVRATRRAQGLTQAELARRAGVGRQWLVGLERGHDGAPLWSVASVTRALDLTLVVPPPPADNEPRPWLTARDAAMGIAEDVARGDAGFALRTIGRLLVDLAERGDEDEVALLLAEPPSTGDHRWDTLLAVALRRACRLDGRGPPAWTDVAPLSVWWWPVFDPVLVARTVQRTPIDLAEHGIWLDARALEVV